MGIQYNDVKYYKSAVVDFADPLLNGGDIDTISGEIINDTLHSIFPEVSATQRENGIILRAKVFVSNESPDRKMQDTIFYIKQDVQPYDRLKLYVASTNVSVEGDEDFATLKEFVNSTVKSTIVQGITILDISIDNKDLYAIGDNLIILDSYFRATYRGIITDVQNHPSDATSASITLNKPYSSGTTIPALAGSISNGDKSSLLITENKALWMELTIAPTNAIDSEIVNQFQLGVHFDDVANP